jgi:hypothetical protein
MFTAVIIERMPPGASRERVTARLTQLRDVYDGFDIQQTTLSVGPEEFERVCGDDTSTTLAEVVVTDSAGRHLLVRRDGGWHHPETAVDDGEPLVPTVREAVARRTGLTPRIETVTVATIVAIECEPCDGAAYQLRVQFAASPDEGEVRDPAAWRSDSPEMPVVK